jgi:hypothetical protein
MTDVLGTEAADLRVRMLRKRTIWRISFRGARHHISDNDEHNKPTEAEPAVDQERVSGPLPSQPVHDPFHELASRLFLTGRQVCTSLKEFPILFSSQQEAMEDANNDILQQIAGRTVIVTGGANGIGAETTRLFSFHGANVVIADLESTRADAERLIVTLPLPAQAHFFATNILSWYQMKLLFRQTIERFGGVHLVVANAGIMESRSVFDMTAVDSKGELEESVDGFRVLDVNIKGTVNSKSNFCLKRDTWTGT